MWHVFMAPFVRCLPVKDWSYDCVSYSSYQSKDNGAIILLRELRHTKCIKWS